MARVDQIGRPKSFVGTPNGGSATTIIDLVKMDVEPDVEQHEHMANNRFPETNFGNDKSKLVIRTTDKRAQSLFFAGCFVASVTCIWRSTDTSVNQDNEVSGAADAITWTCSYMKVDGPVKVTPEADGKPAEFEITMKPHRNAGADPTIGFTYPV